MGADEIKKTEKQVVTGRGESTRGLPNFIPHVDTVSYTHLTLPTN